MKNKNISDEQFKKLIGILGFYTAGQLKKLADNAKKNNFKLTRRPTIYGEHGIMAHTP